MQLQDKFEIKTQKCDNCVEGDDIKPRPIMLKILPIMLLSSAQKVTHYAQYYAHNYCNYATVHTQFYYS